MASVAAALAAAFAFEFLPLDSLDTVSRPNTETKPNGIGC